MSQHPYKQVSGEVFAPTSKLKLLTKSRVAATFIAGIIGAVIGIAIISTWLQSTLKSGLEVQAQQEALRLSQQFANTLNIVNFYSINQRWNGDTIETGVLDRARESVGAQAVSFLHADGTALSTVGSIPVDINLSIFVKSNNDNETQISLVEGRNDNFVAIVRPIVDGDTRVSPVTAIVWLFPQSLFSKEIELALSGDGGSFGAFATDNGFIIAAAFSPDEGASPVFLDLKEYPANLRAHPENEVRVFSLPGGIARDQDTFQRETIIATARVSETNIIATFGVETAPWVSWPNALLLFLALIIPTLGLMTLFSYLIGNEWRKIDIAGREQITRLNRYIAANKLAGIGVLEWYPNRMETVYSEAWKSILGYNEAGSSLPTAFWFDRIHEEDRERAVNNLENIAAGKVNTIEQSYRLKTLDKEYITVFEQAARVSDRARGETSIILVHREK